VTLPARSELKDEIVAYATTLADLEMAHLSKWW
jgi:hypothetical protein